MVFLSLRWRGGLFCGGRAGSQGAQQGLDAGGGHGDVLLAGAAADADSPDDLAIRLDGEAAHEDREAAGVHGMDAEGLVAGQGRPPRRLVEAMSGPAVAGRGEGLGDGDLDAGEPGARHAMKGERVPAVVADADGLEHPDRPRPGRGRLQDDLRVLEGEPLDRDHGSSTQTWPASTRAG